MKTKYIKIPFLLAIATLFSALVACSHSTPEERQQRMLKRITDKLDLTTEQKPYAEKLVVALSTIREDMRSERQQQFPQIRSLITGDNITEQDINTLIDGQLNIIKAHRQEIANSVIEFHKVLNNEQKQQLDKILARIEEHLDDRHH